MLLKFKKIAVCLMMASVLVPFSLSAAEKVLRIGASIFPDTLSTNVSSFAALSLNTQTAEPLILRENDASLKPGLAVKWEALNAVTWRFHLRKGVKFHDGVAFTANDVKHTLDYILDPKTVYGSKRRITQISETRVVDDLTVDIITKKPFPTLLRGLSDIVIEPMHYQKKVGRKGMARHPIGTGPFKFLKWTPGDSYELEANKNYWGGAPKVDRVVIRQIPEGVTRVASLLAGETHIIEEVPVDLISKVESTSGVELAATESTVGLLLTMDARKKPFNDIRVRKAMNYAIDKEMILKQLLYGNGALLNGQTLTSNTFGHNPNLSAYPYDVKKAKQLLKEAGYQNGFETSITTRSGKYLSDVDISNAISGMLMQVGIKTGVNVVEGGVYSKMVKAREMGPMHMVGWYSLGDADFSTVWFTDGSNRAYWKNDEYEKLFLEGRSTMDVAVREKAYHRMMEIINEEAPAMFLFGLPSVYAKSSKVKGWGPASDKLLRLSDVELSD